MEKLKGLAIELDMDHLAVDRGLRGLKDNLRTVNSEMKRNMSVFDRSDKSVKKYETSLMGLNKKLEVQKVAVAEAQKEYEKMVEQHGRGSKEAEKAARDYNNQAAALNNLERYIERTKNELAEFEKQQRIANSSWTKWGDKLENYGGKLKGIGGQIDNVGSQMTNKITKPAVGVVAAVGGIVTAFGWKRLTSLDAAQAQLKGLGFSVKEVERISGDVRKAVQGTTMTMAEGTSVAAGALAAGVKEGKELEKYIRRVGNAAIGANRPVNEMAQIFNRVQGAGKLMTQELNQIEHGMPGFSQAMAKHLGVPPEKMREMVTAGEVTSKDFAKVMDDFAGGMAKEYAKTWDGMVSNTKANIGIIGETFLRGVFQDSKKSLADFIDMLKSPEIKQKAEEMGVVARDAFNKTKDSIMGVVEWYQNLDDSQKTMIKRLGLIAVAGGPVLQFTGKMTSGLGSVLEVTGKVSKAIGVARGAGLAAGLASLGPGAIAGVAVAGIGAVGLALYNLHKDTEQSIEDILKHTQQRKEEIDALDDTIEAYEKLQAQNKLTTDEVLRYMDIMTELKNAQTEDAIKQLTKEQESLLKKSGLTNDEMDEFLRLNGVIVSETPAASQTVSEHGNAYAETTEKIKELNLAERERLQGETFLNITGELHTQKETLEEQERLQATLKEQESDRIAMIEDLNERSAGLNDLKGNERRVAEKLLQADQERLSNLEKRISETNKSIEKNDKELEQFNQLVGEYEAMVLHEVNLVSEKGKGNEAIKVRQSEIEKTIKKLEQEHKAGSLTTEEFEKQNKELAEEQKKLDEAKNKLNNMQTEIDKATGKYKNQGDQIDKNNQKTDTGIKKEQERSKEAGRSVDKDIVADDNGRIKVIDRKASESKNKSVIAQEQGFDPIDRKASTSKTKPVIGLGKNFDLIDRLASATKSKRVEAKGYGIDAINREASKTVTKRVNVFQRLKGMIGYASGTPKGGHPGGMAMIGEEGRELVNLPDGRSFISPDTHTVLGLPKGTHVLPNKQTEHILKNMPKYASGTQNWNESFGNSEFSRLLMTNSRLEPDVIVQTNNIKRNENNESQSLNKLLQATLEQNKLLMQLLKKDTNVTINKRDMVDIVNEQNALDGLGKIF